MVPTSPFLEFSYPIKALIPLCYGTRVLLASEPSIVIFPDYCQCLVHAWVRLPLFLLVRWFLSHVYSIIRVCDGLVP